jgi:hypothetical protein
MTFFGQVRDRLAVYSTDSHERLVLDIMDWELMQCGINKDVKVNDSLHFVG